MFACLTLDFNHCQVLLFMQLWIGHISLNLHLFWICKVNLPMCPHCWGIMVESVTHFSSSVLTIITSGTSSLFIIHLHTTFSHLCSQKWNCHSSCDSHNLWLLLCDVVFFSFPSYGSCCQPYVFVVLLLRFLHWMVVGSMLVTGWDNLVCQAPPSEGWGGKTCIISGTVAKL